MYYIFIFVAYCKRNLKKVIAISLILIFLLNVVGYYGFFLGLHYANRLAMNGVSENQNYRADETFEVKIFLNVAYATDATDFKKVTGQFEYKGEFYQMVKQKLAHDTLTVICLKDHAQKKIKTALEDVVKSFTGSPPNAEHGVKTLPTLFKEYIQSGLKLSNVCSGWEDTIAQNSNRNSFISDYTSSILHPPDRG